MLLCTYQRPSQGIDPGTYGGITTGLTDFYRQFLARDGGIGPLLHFRGKVHGICYIAAILKMKDPDHRDLVYLSNRPQVSMGYLSNRPQVSMVYLSNRPQVSVVYKLINYAGCC